MGSRFRLIALLDTIIALLDTIIARADAVIARLDTVIARLEASGVGIIVVRRAGHAACGSGSDLHRVHLGEKAGELSVEIVIARRRRLIFLEVQFGNIEIVRQRHDTLGHIDCLDIGHVFVARGLARLRRRHRGCGREGLDRLGRTVGRHRGDCRRCGHGCHRSGRLSAERRLSAE